MQHGRERAIVYGGRNFSDTEKKYSITEREALSVVIAIQKWRLYLLGNHFTVVVDYQVLKWLRSLRDPTGRLARWALTLQGYDFTIQYHLGLNKAYERLRPTYFWNNIFANLQRGVKSCLLCPEEKRRSPLQTISSAYCRLWAMESWCRRLYGPPSGHEFRKSVDSYCPRPLYKVYRNCSLAFNRNCYHHPGVFG